MLPRADQFQPRFVELPTVPGCPDLRIVDGQFMDSETYHQEGWHVVDVYTLGDSDEQHWAWMAELPGLRRHSQLSAQRRADARVAFNRRNEEDASFRAYVDAVEDAAPAGYGRAAT